MAHTLAEYAPRHIDQRRAGLDVRRFGQAARYLLVNTILVGGISISVGEFGSALYHQAHYRHDHAACQADPVANAQRCTELTSADDDSLSDIVLAGVAVMVTGLATLERSNLP